MYMWLRGQDHASYIVVIVKEKRLKMARKHNINAFTQMLEEKKITGITWDLGKSNDYIKTIYLNGACIVANGQQYNMSSKNPELFYILEGNIEVMSDKSMASSKVEKAHERGNIELQSRTYVKDNDNIDSFSPDDELRLMNIYNIDELIFDFAFIKKYNIDLTKAKDIVKLTNGKYITKHGLELIKKIEKRDKVCLGVV